MTNFLVIVTDDHGWPHYGVRRPDGREMPALYRRRGEAGQTDTKDDPLPPPITPGFDALAARGTTFTKAWSACSVCIPSRWSQATGLMPYQFTTSGMASRTFPALLGERYERFGGGKIRIPSDDEQWGDGGWWSGSEKGSKVIRQGLEKFFEFLDKRKAYGRPWLAYLGPTLPHKGFVSSATYVDALKPYTGADGKPLYLVDDGVPYDKPPYHLSRNHRGYYGNISLLDAGLLEIVRYFDAEKLWDDTIVVCHSDNGPERDLLDAAKFSFTDRGPRTLFFLAGRGAPRGVVNDDALMHTTDVFATVADYAGLAVDEPKHGFYGRSLRPWIEGTTAPAWRHMVLHQDSNNRNTPKQPEQRAVTHRTGLRLEIPAKGGRGLYDLGTDAAQSRNWCHEAVPKGALAKAIDAAATELARWPQSIGRSIADAGGTLDEALTTAASLVRAGGTGSGKALDEPAGTSTGARARL